MCYISYIAKSIERFEPIKKEQTWGTETLIARAPTYIGKILEYQAGHAGGLQYHVEKDEAFYLFEGEAWVDYDAGDDKLTRVRITHGMSFRNPPGAVHRFEAITDCIVFEVSTPHFNDRVRREEYYGVPVIGNDPGLPTTWGDISGVTLRSIERFEPVTKEQSWGEEILVVQADLYTGKILKRYTTGTRGGLQFHPHRDETFYLHEGEALLYFVDADDVLRSHYMVPEESFHVPPGAIHSVLTLTDSVMFEASHPIPDNLTPRVNVEKQYDISQAVDWS